MINSWLSIRDDFNMADPDNIAILLVHSHDWSVVGGIYVNESDAGRTWDLWSIYYPTKPAMDAALASLAAMNPGRTRALGQWDDSGAQTEMQYPQLIRYMPDVWNGDEPPTYSPPVVVSDVNLLAGQAQRVFT